MKAGKSRVDKGAVIYTLSEWWGNEKQVRRMVWRVRWMRQAGRSKEIWWTVNYQAWSVFIAAITSCWLLTITGNTEQCEWTDTDCLSEPENASLKCRFNFVWLILSWHTLWTVGPYMYKCTPFETMSNQINLPQVAATSRHISGKIKAERTHLSQQIVWVKLDISVCFQSFENDKNNYFTFISSTKKYTGLNTFSLSLDFKLRYLFPLES